MDPSRPTGWRRALVKSALALFVGVATWGPTQALARDTERGAAGRPVDVEAQVALATLPPQAQETHRLILAGGPFPYRKDGTVFFNRERLLPQRPRGHYREYTVKTPGSRDRGARRIVCGGSKPSQPDACYYTADHYNSFRRIVH